MTIPRNGGEEEDASAKKYCFLSETRMGRRNKKRQFSRDTTRYVPIVGQYTKTRSRLGTHCLKIDVQSRIMKPFAIFTREQRGERAGGRHS